MPQPGEPLFTDEDTVYAMALAEEEAATCPSCGLLKVVCRDPAYQFGGFEATDEICWATHAVAEKRIAFKDAHDATRAAVQISPRYREGKEPAVDVGLELDALTENEDDSGEKQ